MKVEDVVAVLDHPSAEKAPFGQRPVARLEVLVGDAQHHGAPVQAAGDELHAAAQRGRGNTHLGHVSRDRGGILLGQALARAGLEAHTTLGEFVALVVKS